MSAIREFIDSNPATKPYKKLTVADKRSLIADSLIAKPCNYCKAIYRHSNVQDVAQCVYCHSDLRQRWQVERRMQNLRPYIQDFIAILNNQL